MNTVILVVVATVAIAAGLFCGGKMARLQEVTLKHETLLVSMLVARVIVPFLGERFALGSHTVSALWLAVCGVLVAVAASNLREKGFAMVVAGLVSNSAVILLNGGMPFNTGSLSEGAGITRIPADDAFHLISSAQTRLSLLGDVLPVPGPPALRGLVSIGDVLMFIGAAVFVVRKMQAPPDLKYPPSA